MTAINRHRLFWLSVLALFTASMSASLRAAVASSLKAEWIDPIAPIAAGEMIGAALGSAFLGFSITVFVVSAFLDTIGIRRVLIGCGIAFLIGTTLIVGAGSMATGMTVYHLVWLGMLLSGIGWGFAESSINPLTALLDCPNGELRQHPDRVALICREVAAVIEREGYHTSESDLRYYVDQVIESTAENISSMLQDIRAMRHTEIDYITGYLLKRARAHGITVAENSRLFELVKRKESEYERIGTGMPRPW